jgi:hypothetical protein
MQKQRQAGKKGKRFGKCENDVTVMEYKKFRRADERRGAEEGEHRGREELKREVVGNTKRGKENREGLEEKKRSGQKRTEEKTQ